MTKLTQTRELKQAPETMAAAFEGRVLASALREISKVGHAHDDDIEHSALLSALLSAAQAADECRDAIRSELAKEGLYRWDDYDLARMAVATAFAAWLVGEEDVSDWKVHSRYGCAMFSFGSFTRTLAAASALGDAMSDSEGYSPDNANEIARKLLKLEPMDRD